MSNVTSLHLSDGVHVFIPGRPLPITVIGVACDFFQTNTKTTRVLSSGWCSNLFAPPTPPLHRAPSLWHSGVAKQIPETHKRIKHSDVITRSRGGFNRISRNIETKNRITACVSWTRELPLILWTDQRAKKHTVVKLKMVMVVVVVSFPLVRAFALISNVLLLVVLQRIWPRLSLEYFRFQSKIDLCLRRRFTSCKAFL